MATAIHELSALLSRLPGVGKRTATRLAFHLIDAPEEYARRLGENIASLHQRVTVCSVCGNLDDVDPCSICTAHGRDDRAICVVAGVPDLWAVEESSAFRGRFHVLHGLLSPIDGKGPDDLNLASLRSRVESNGIEEVVIATRPSVEGEATALLVRETLSGIAVKVTRIATGVPHGGELEYADSVTLGRAFDDRRDV
jgi:recombination protein RecR